jgi:N-acetyl-gamma-glutamyl-phosphate reductase
MPGAAKPAELRDALAEFYAASRLVTVHEDTPDELLVRRSGAPSDRLDLHVRASANGSQARLIAVLDNLGKGASGAAVQNLNLMAELPEMSGLRF